MKEITKEEIVAIMRTVKDPELGKDLVTLGMLKEIKIDGANVILDVVLTTPACPLKDRITDDIRLAIRGNIPHVGEIKVNFDADVKSSRPMSDTNRIPGIKHVIAVGSGKGGVGKSTIAANLALALQQEGARVGLLDADIYGPSMGIMFGVPEGEKPKVNSENRIMPIMRFDMPLMSMGFLIGAQEAVVWRGPMLAKMLQQFLEQVNWGELDYLVLDLPPGTGDVQLTLSQLIPVSGAVIVGTPQDVAMADVARAVKMFNMTQVPILGIVENMSGFDCPHCHEVTRVFGGGSQDKSRYEKMNLTLLGELPLELDTRVAGDAGAPIVVKDPQSAQAKRFRALAQKIAAAISVKSYESELQLPVLH
ncbi:MAG: Mrp/NBP35 family ATP-binding protein [Deltaproteobacteria bacterium]|nr:MAG: Mrp/NBP35 family ATP-binding protein [Deltaproteobacteria bacterium]